MKLHIARRVIKLYSDDFGADLFLDELLHLPDDLDQLEELRDKEEISAGMYDCIEHAAFEAGIR